MVSVGDAVPGADLEALKAAHEQRRVSIPGRASARDLKGRRPIAKCLSGLTFEPVQLGDFALADPRVPKLSGHFRV